MFNKVRDRGNETAMSNDRRPRLAITILFSRPFALFFSLLLVVAAAAAVMSGSSLKRCLRFWDSMEEREREKWSLVVYDN